MKKNKLFLYIILNLFHLNNLKYIKFEKIVFLDYFIYFCFSGNFGAGCTGLGFGQHSPPSPSLSGSSPTSHELLLISFPLDACMYFTHIIRVPEASRGWST